MYEQDESAEHEAMTRLFDLTRNGETDNCEYSQLDSMIYGRLEQAYGRDGTAPLQAGAIQVQTAEACPQPPAVAPRTNRPTGWPAPTGRQGPTPVPHRKHGREGKRGERR